MQNYKGNRTRVVSVPDSHGRRRLVVGPGLASSRPAVRKFATREPWTAPCPECVAGERACPLPTPSSGWNPPRRGPPSVLWLLALP